MIATASKKWIWRLSFASVVAVIIGVVIIVNRPTPEPNSSDKRQFPLPPFSESNFLNTGADARYVGVQVCVGCHDSNYQSYLHTAHSRAFSDLNPKDEPPDGSFHHEPSGRFYSVYRQGDEFRHKEVVRKQEGEEVASIDLPIRFLVGSGHATRSYLVEVDGFLHESPISWYVSKKKWAMSPGYDHPRHQSFERLVDVGCLQCHTGRVESKDGAFNRLAILEKTIGCESCHGPGSIHVDYYQSEKPGKSERLSIVNPAKLPRRLQEAICAQCHLRGDATVHLRGRKMSDFRPGRPLTDYRVDYQFKVPSDVMKVVGHIEQMRLSRCYKISKTLTCITCHDPHLRTPPKDPVAHYRKVCLNCHKLDSCGLEHTKRVAKNAADNCMACHMPRSDTDIPHIAFTHHRIGLHKNKKPPSPNGIFPQLVPMEDVSHLPDIDRKRNLGLAYVEVSYKQRHPAGHQTYQMRALDLLTEVYQKGLHDAEIEEALARLYWEIDPNRAADFAEKALQRKTLASAFRPNALLILADHKLETGDLSSAISYLQELTTIRRHSEDWRLLGLCHLKKQRPKDAIKALQYAVSVNPFRPIIHEMLADAYRQTGDAKRAAQHREKAQLLSR